jgi:hypothetical protein
MFCYCCLLCGNIYVVRKNVRGDVAMPQAVTTPDAVPDWAPVDGMCPVCGGLAFPCEGARNRLIPSETQVAQSARLQS